MIDEENLENIPTEGDIPVVSYAKHPLNGTMLDLYYQDPEKNQHGVITIITSMRENAMTYESNKWKRENGKKEEVEESRDKGVHPQNPSSPDENPFYKGFDIIVNNEIIYPFELHEALNMLSEHYGQEFYYKPVEDGENPRNKLPKIKRLCHICRKPVPEEELETVIKGHPTEWKKDKKVCSDKCKSIAKL